MYWTARQRREFFWESWFTKRDKFHHCVATLSYRFNAFMTVSGIIHPGSPGMASGRYLI